jgi:hypothetical protein
MGMKKEIEEPQQTKPISRPLLLSVIAVILVICLSVVLWSYHLRIQSEAVIGQWYCLDDGMLYVFEQDGSLEAYIGTLVYIEGNWKQGWKRGNLIVQYEKDGKSIRETVEFRLEDENQVLYIFDMDQQNLKMKRYK